MYRFGPWKTVMVCRVCDNVSPPDDLQGGFAFPWDECPKCDAGSECWVRNVQARQVWTNELRETREQAGLLKRLLAFFNIKKIHVYWENREVFLGWQRRGEEVRDVEEQYLES
jgi:hypothetical protein